MRGPVPDPKRRLHHQVGRSARDEHVSPEVSEPPAPARVPQETEERLLPRPAQPVVHAREDHERVIELPVARVELATVPVRATSPDGLVSLAERRRARHPEHRPAFDLEREERRPDGHAVREVPRAVDRVHDPDPVPGTLPLLLAGHGVGGVAVGDHLADRGLHLEVGLGDRASGRASAGPRTRRGSTTSRSRRRDRRARERRTAPVRTRPDATSRDAADQVRCAALTADEDSGSSSLGLPWRRPSRPPIRIPSSSRSRCPKRSSARTSTAPTGRSRTRSRSRASARARCRSRSSTRRSGRTRSSRSS